MSTADTSGFGKFVPGFDFLQNLAKAAGSNPGAAAGVPNLSQWLVPSLKVEDLEKRIEELKHVQFWLDQNARALSATIQALEVQKMTMETLKGMNFSMGMPGAASAAPATPAPEPPAAKPEPAPTAQRQAKTDKGSAEAATVIDPVALWGSLTQQFQTIAANALKDVAKHSAPPVKKAPVRSKAATKSKPATKTAARTRRKAS